jgi:hypothetical protein
MDSETVRWKNDHNIYVNTGLANQEQLQASAEAFKKELCNMFPKQGYEKCEMIVNLVTDMKGNSYKFAYLWVSDPRVYFILAGLNPDGSERFKDIEEKKEEDCFDLDNLNLEDAFTEVTAKIKKPVIREPLPPILTLPGYEYTPEQKARAEDDLKKEAISRGKNPDDVVVPNFGYFDSSRAWAGTPKKNEISSTLCSYVPIWVTEDILKKIFFRYSSDKSGVYPKISFRQIKKKVGFESRFENTVEKKLAVVEFSPSYNRDGIFALQMTRKIMIKDPAEEAKARKEGKPVEEIKPSILIFEHYKHAEDPNDGHKPHYNNKAYGGGGGGSGSYNKGKKW